MKDSDRIEEERRIKAYALNAQYLRAANSAFTPGVMGMNAHGFPVAGDTGYASAADMTGSVPVGGYTTNAVNPVLGRPMSIWDIYKLAGYGQYQLYVNEQMRGM